MNATDSGAQRCVSKGFAPAVRYPTSGEPLSLVALGPARSGQMNLLIEEQSNDTVLGELMLGAGDASFTLAPFVSDLVPTGVATADFNGDDEPDLVNLVIDPNGTDQPVGSGELQIAMGTGAGTFTPHVVTYHAPRTQGLLTTGDFDGDGHPDIALAGYDGVLVVSDLPGVEPVNFSLDVFRNAGDGTFEPPVAYSSSTYFSNIATGDFNGDSKLDIAEQLSSGWGLEVFPNAGDGTFPNEVTTTPANLEPGPGLESADFDGDGKDDLAVTANVLETVVNVVAVFPGSADGTLHRPARTQITRASVYAIATGDFNGDGKPDLALVLGASPVDEPSAPSRIAVLVGHGDGTFASPVNYDIDAGASAVATTIAVGDFNHDGITDIATGVVDSSDGSSVNVLLSQCE